MGQSRGWLARRNSMIPSLALCVIGELVLTTIPGWTGHAQEATGFGTRSTSTRHIRQLPAMRSFLGSQRSAHTNIITQLAPLDLLMITVSRDSNSSLLASLDQGRASFYGHFLPINGEFNFRGPSCRGVEGSLGGRPRQGGPGVRSGAKKLRPHLDRSGWSQLQGFGRC